MMCSIHIDETAIHLSVAAGPSHLCVPLSEKLDSLFDRLVNRHMIHDSQSDALEWVCKDQNDALYCGVMTLHGLFIPLSFCADSHLTLLHFSLRVSSLFLHLESMEDKRDMWQNRLRIGVRQPGSAWAILGEARTQSTHISIQYHILSSSMIIIH
jgi:hypothetical protein